MRRMAVLSICVATASTASAQPTIFDLGEGYVGGISADGSTVIGSCVCGSNSSRAFLWTAAGGRRLLGVLPGGVASIAAGVSGDGSVVVGVSRETQEFGRAFRWTAQGGMEDLGAFPGARYSEATGVSADGGVVVGWSHVPGGGTLPHGFRWTRGLGLVDLGMPEGAVQLRPKACSADGSVVVGWAELVGRATRPVIWTADAGVRFLDEPADVWNCSPSAVSADGAFLVGHASFSDGWPHMVRWAGGRARDLGLPPPLRYASAHAVTSDGLIVTGSGWLGNSDQALVWTPGTGVARLADFLESRGVAVGGRLLWNAPGVTPDGTSMAGTSLVAGVPSGWVVQGLEPVCAADFNGDGFADFFDYSAFVACFETGVCPPWREGDFNGDGFADFFDYDDFVAAFEAGC